MPRDFSNLAENLKKLEKLPARVTKEVAEGIEEDINKCFDKGEDPYGNSWAALKTGGKSYLQKTGDMRDSLDVSVLRGSGIRITMSESPTIFHLFGTSKMVARPMLPTGEMPKNWQKIIEDAYGRAYKGIMK